MPLEPTFISSWYEDIIGNPPRPRFKPFKPNRVDALPGLLQWHENCTTSTLNLKSSNLPLSTLPIRSRVRLSLPDPERRMDLHIDQTHANYEEINNIPAAAVGTESAFEEKHWHIIHPLQQHQVQPLSTRVLQDLRTWIQDSIHVYVGEHRQIKDFLQARAETMQVVLNELARRDADAVGDEEGYLGAWCELSNVEHEVEADEIIDTVSETAIYNESEAMGASRNNDGTSVPSVKEKEGHVEELIGVLEDINLTDSK